MEITLLNYRDAYGITTKYEVYERRLAEVKAEVDGHARASSQAFQDYQAVTNRAKALEAEVKRLKSLIEERDSTHIGIITSLKSKYEAELVEQAKKIAKHAKELVWAKEQVVEEYEQFAKYTQWDLMLRNEESRIRA